MFSFITSRMFSFLLPSNGDFVWDDDSETRVLELRSANRLADELIKSVVTYAGYTIHNPLPSSIIVPFSHTSYFNPSGRIT